MVIECVVRILRAEPPLAGEENSRAVRRRAGNAEGRTSGSTAFAGAATRDEDEDDVIAYLEVINSVAQCLDHASGLVAQYHGQGSGPVAVDHRQIGVT